MCKCDSKWGICAWPSSWQLSFLFPPAYGWSRVSLNLTLKVHCVIRKYHLIHRPTYKHGPLCGRESIRDTWVRQRTRARERHTDRGNPPNTTSSAGSLSFSPTILVPTQTYIPASLFRVFEIISFPPRICEVKQAVKQPCQREAFIKHPRETDTKNRIHLHMKTSILRCFMNTVHGLLKTNGLEKQKIQKQNRAVYEALDTEMTAKLMHLECAVIAHSVEWMIRESYSRRVTHKSHHERQKTKRVFCSVTFSVVFQNVFKIWTCFFFLQNYMMKLYKF